MECIKCGRETDGSQAFCSDCLTQMAQHPIKPGTPVHIPVRPTGHEKAAARSREQTPAQTIAQLRRTIRGLTVTVAILSLLLCATAAFLLHALGTQTESGRPGRNYTVDTFNTSP